MHAHSLHAKVGIDQLALAVVAQVSLSKHAVTLSSRNPQVACFRETVQCDVLLIEPCRELQYHQSAELLNTDCKPLSDMWSRSCEVMASCPTTPSWYPLFHPLFVCNLQDESHHPKPAKKQKH